MIFIIMWFFIHRVVRNVGVELTMAPQPTQAWYPGAARPRVWETARNTVEVPIRTTSIR